MFVFQLPCFNEQILDFIIFYFSPFLHISVFSIKWRWRKPLKVCTNAGEKYESCEFQVLKKNRKKTLVRPSKTHPKTSFFKVQQLPSVDDEQVAVAVEVQPAAPRRLRLPQFWAQVQSWVDPLQVPLGALQPVAPQGMHWSTTYNKVRVPPFLQKTQNVLES